MSQGTIDAAARGTVDQKSQPKARGLLVSKNDLLPLMALFGAIYGWIVVVVALIVAAVVVLVC